MSRWSSVGEGIAGFLVLPLVLVAATIWFERSPARRRAGLALALGMFWLSVFSLLAAVFLAVTAAGGEAFAIQDVLLNVAAVAFCGAGLGWGAVCAANILERPTR
jgi:hypothetical protein